MTHNQSGAELRIQDGGTYKVSHIGKQPTSLDGGLGSVSRIPLATKIKQNVTQLGYLQCPMVLNERGPSGTRS